MKIIGKVIILFLAITSISSFTQAQSHYCSKYKGDTDGKRLEIEDHRSDSIDIINTDISLNFEQMAVGYIEGYSTISFSALMSGVEELRLDFEGLEVDSVQGISGLTYNQLATKLIISFAGPLTVNQVQDIEIYYHGNPIKDGSGWGGFYFQNGFAWNLGVGFESDPHSYGRIWFPCFDNFIERSTFHFSITTPDDKVASCNGLLDGMIDNNDGTMTYLWEIDQSIPSYLTCVAVGSYEILQDIHQGIDENFPIQLFARANDTANLKASFIHLQDAITAFEEAYGAYKFDKVGYSLVPFNAGAMEHATNITYPIYAANGTTSQEDLMAHELGHMWWGDNVTCQTDGDMWINEGWASFSVYLFMEHVYGRNAYEEVMKADLKHMLQYGHHYEEEYRPVAGQPHEYVYGDHVYKKGALVAHNLRAYMGDEAFFSAIQDFMDAYEFESVSSDTLERYFSAHSGQDLSYFFRDWVFNPGYNAVVLDSFVKSGVNGNYSIGLHLQQKLKGTTTYHKDVPVYYTIYNADWQSESGKTTMSSETEIVEVTSTLDPAWIVLYERNELANARTVDQMVIQQSGSLNLNNAYWSVDIESVDDSSLLRIEQIWAAPDPIKAFDTKPYKLNNYRYWKVSGLALDGLEMNASFFYDGRSTGSSGFLDLDLLSESEDSLVLLHRQNATDDWELYENYSKNTLGTSTDGLGLMELSQVKEGEYVLANLDHSVLGNPINKNDQSVIVYPNPSNGKVSIRQEEFRATRIEFVGIDGKLLQGFQLKSADETVDLMHFVHGVYLYRLYNKDNEVISNGRLVLE